MLSSSLNKTFPSSFLPKYRLLRTSTLVTIAVCLNVFMSVFSRSSLMALTSIDVFTYVSRTAGWHYPVNDPNTSSNRDVAYTTSNLAA